MKSIQYNSKIWSLLLGIGILVSLGGCSYNNLPADDGPKKYNPQKDKAIDPNHEKTVAEVVDAIQKKLSGNQDYNKEWAERVKQTFKGKKINEGLDEKDRDKLGIIAKGTTLLHLFARYGRPEGAKLAVEEGASWATKDDEGNTPLHSATEHPSQYYRVGTDQFGKILNGIKADDLKRLLKISNKKGNTPLHTLAGDTTMASYSMWLSLLERKPKVIDEEALTTLRNKDGNTVLHVLVQKKQKAGTIRDIFSKADLLYNNQIQKLAKKVQNNADKTPYQLAAENPNIKTLFDTGYYP